MTWDSDSEPRIISSSCLSYSSRVRCSSRPDQDSTMIFSSHFPMSVLVVSSIFSLVILRSAHDTFFDTLARTLRIVETLGFSRWRQTILFLILYTIIIPLAFILGGVISYFLLVFIGTYPGAESFGWIFSSFFVSLVLLLLLIFAGFFSAWQSRWGILPEWKG